MEKTTFDAKISQAFDEGYNAYCTGLERRDCPYEFGSHEMAAWDTGFDTAIRESEFLVGF